MQEPNPTNGVTRSSTRIRKRRGPFALVLDLFSSVRFGIVLLTLLFVYATVGSAGVIYPVGFDIFSAENWRHTFPRTWRGIELTEFNFFHTWVFNGLIGLICANIIVTTLRKIPFNALKAGVWMIHAGIIILCVGSVVYFTTKVEGDTPVVRREVVVRFPGSNIAPTSILGLPGNSGEVVGPAGRYRFEIAQIDPEWPILSGADEGKKAYSISVMVQTPEGKQFTRQLLAGFPQYTEDVIPGKGRAKKLPEFGGKAIIDETIELSLDYALRDRFWVKDSSAIFARLAGTRSWVERPIDHLPRYNDYLTGADDVWSFRAGEQVPIDPLDIPLASPPTIEPGVTDPLADVKARIVGFLRYAVPRANFLTGRGSVFPIMDVRFMNNEGRMQDARLLALDPGRATAMEGLVSFRWVEDAAALEALATNGKRALELMVPGMEEAVTFDITPADMDEATPPREIGTTGYTFKPTGMHERLATSDGSAELNVLVVEFTLPDKTTKITRWVSDDPARSRDVGTADPATGHSTMNPADPTIKSRYIPSRLSAVTLVAGPEPVGLWALIGADEKGTPRRERLQVGASVNLTSVLAMTVMQYAPDGIEVVRPVIVPREQRDRDTDEVRIASHVLVELSKGDWKDRKWVRFHRYPFESEAYHNAGLAPYEPVDFTLPDGRHVEMIFAQRSHPLPHKVALDDFVLTEHVGGYEIAGTSGVRDWTSVLKFSEDDGKSWTEPLTVSPNKPVEQDGWWYFQAYWDPPSGGRPGLNFTGLGVGNREGVYTQLAGCTISVIGMIYAFYFKPIIRRRRREKVLAQVKSGELRSARQAAQELEEPELVNGESR